MTTTTTRRPAKTPARPSAAVRAGKSAGTAGRVHPDIDSGAPQAVAPETGVAPIERVTRAVERELLQIEAILYGEGAKARAPTAAERRARTLASLARTLAEVKKLRAADETSAYAPSAARDLDEFRLALYRRLEGVVARTASGPNKGDDAQ